MYTFPSPIHPTRPATTSTMTSRRLQITLKRHVLRWARQRTGHSQKALAKKIPVKTRERHPMGTDRQNQRRSGRQTRRQDLYTPQIPLPRQSPRREPALPRLPHVRRPTAEPSEPQPARHNQSDAAPPSLVARRTYRIRRRPPTLRR